MKNIHLLPTDKPSRLKQNKITKKISLVNKGIDLTSYTPINIYITSDEEIKQGDWHLVWLRDKWEVLNYMPSIGYRKECLGKEVCKIILTTDQDLIADGVQSIDDEFLEWFVHNPSCEKADIKKIYLSNKGEWKDVLLPSEWEVDTKINYKIIIPKEEPKQETLEKVAENYANDWEEIHPELDSEDMTPIAVSKIDFIAGAQWQQERMYSEEDMIKFAKWSNRKEDKSKADLLKTWFEQFKKKTYSETFKKDN